MEVPCPNCGAANVPHARYCAQCGQAMLPGQDGGDPIVGTTVAGRYDVLRRLGEGSMGRVYLANQRMGSTTRPVALKILRMDVGHDSSMAERFHRECRVLVSLTHPNTIRVFDFGELADGAPFIATEYVAGRSLAEVIHAEGALDPGRVEPIVAQIAGALTEAHEHGIVHRDLKPENIMLSDEPRPDFVKVLDFGIAKRVAARLPTEGSVTAKGMVLGTPAYMSPEQFTGQTLTPRSDVYSLGVVTYQMLTGILPFHAGTPGEWASKHLTAKPAPFDDHPAGVRVGSPQRAAVLRALAKDPGERQSDVWAFARELTGSEPSQTEWLPGASQASAAGTAEVERASRESIRLPGARRGLAVVLGAVAGLVMLGIGAAVLVVSDRAAEEPTFSEDTVSGQSSDADASGVVPPEPGAWFGSVHHVRNASDAQEALGEADGSYAVLRPGAVLTLELGQGRAYQPDGTSEPDLVVVAAGDGGTYRVDVSVDHHDFQTVAPSARGEVRVDLDARGAGARPLRYVRVLTHPGEEVRIDAVRAVSVIEKPRAAVGDLD